MALLISGHTGSGKSVLRYALHVPPRVIILEGFYCFAGIDVPYEAHVRGLKAVDKMHNFVRARAPWGFPVYLLLLRARLRPGQPVRLDDVEEVLRRIFPRAKIIGDTANQYLYRLHLTVDRPGLDHIIVYRDCRDVVAEHRRRVTAGAVPEKPTQEVAQNWCRSIQIMEDHCDRIQTVRYETLVRDPQAVLTPLADWLGLSPDLPRFDFIRPNRIGAFREVLTAVEVAEIETIAGPTLARLGYT